MAEVVCLHDGEVVSVELHSKPPLVNSLEVKSEIISITDNDREISKSINSIVDGNSTKLESEIVTVLDNDRGIVNCLDRNSSIRHLFSKEEKTVTRENSFVTISAVDNKNENSAIQNEDKIVNPTIFGNCSESITITDDNVEAISIGSTDSSSDEENLKISNPTKRVTRRGLNLAELCSNNCTYEVKCPTSAIYSSKILNFREQKRNLNECFSSLNPSTLSDDDSIFTISEKTEQNSKDLLEEENTDQVNCDDVRWATTVSNKRRNSPSPPPEHHPIAKKMTRKTRKLLSNIEKTMHLYDISKQQHIYESPVLAEKDLPDTYRLRTIVAKFRWQGSILRIPMKRDEKFLSVLPKITERCQTKFSDILLTINEETIQLEDTPNSIDLSSADIIDCYILNSSSSSNDQNTITLLIQASDCKSKVSISIHKLSPIIELMEEYARRRKIPLRNLKFKFDGEILDPTDTPAVLDMENENCIDVVVIS